MNVQYDVESLEQTERAGVKISALMRFPACVYIHGEMGVGKTTLTKAILRGLGYQGAVTSPTYNLIQEYQVANGKVYHMDLYRLEDPAELEFLALTDLWGDNSLFLIEWPQNGNGYLPKPTYELSLNIFFDGDTKKRNIVLTAVS